ALSSIDPREVLRGNRADGAGKLDGGCGKVKRSSGRRGGVGNDRIPGWQIRLTASFQVIPVPASAPRSPVATCGKRGIGRPRDLSAPVLNLLTGRRPPLM